MRNYTKFQKVISCLIAFALLFGCFMKEGLNVKAAEGDKIKIACVGDSLTEGYTSSGGNKGATAYPAVLQSMLGSDYQVGNFGRTSFTLMKGTNKSYWDAAEFTNSKAYDADIVIIMLGTNDSKDAYWNETQFRADAEALYNTYANLESNPRVIFAVSPQCYVMSGTDITAAGVNRMVAVQRDLIAENGWESVDMYALTTDREYYYNRDKVHFTDEGYAYVAKCMYEAIVGDAPVQVEFVTIPYTQTSGTTNYFTFPEGKWYAGDGTYHTWSYPVDTSDPRSMYYEVNFTGNKIDVYAGKNYMMGKVEYFVDDVSYGTFDLYNGSNINSTLITTIGGLEDGAHVFRAEATGEKNASQRGTLAIDAGQVVVYSAIDAETAKIGNITRMFNNSIDPGNNTWVFVGGEAVQGTYEQIGGARNYIGHFEEYIRNQKSAGDDPTRQRYMINTAKAGQTLADVIENWDAKVTKYDPRAVAYLVGVEDYGQGTAHIGAFKESLRAFIDKALAEKENNRSYAMIQKPFAVQDADVNSVIAAYCTAVDDVVAEYADDADKFANIAVIDHFTQTRNNDDFKTNKLNADGSLNELGHLELGRQLVLAAMSMEDQYPARQGVRMGQTAEEQPDEYVNVLSEVTATDNSLKVQIPEEAGSEWKYFLTVDEMTLSETVSGNSFEIDGLITGTDYVLKIQSADGSKQLTTMMGKVKAGEAGVKYQQELNENQQRIADLMASKDSLTWLFVGDSITHALVYTYGYGGTVQMFEKYLKDDLGRVDDVVINTAVSGAYTRSTLDNIDQRVKKYVPDVVAIMLGTNDAHSSTNTTSDQYKENLKTIIAHIREVNPDAVIVLRTPTPMTGDDGRKANALVNIEKMKEVAAEDKSLILVDQYTEMNDALNTYTWLKANSADGTSSVANDQLFLGNWLHPGINGQIVMAKQVMKGMGIWSEDGHIPNLYYETPLAKETSGVTPTLVTAENLIAVEPDILASESGMNIGSITVAATAGTKTYTSTTKAGEDFAVLNGIPNGTYEVVISAYLTNTAKEVTFASQTVTIEEGQTLDFAVTLSNAKAVDLSVGDTVGELSVSSTAPAGEYTFTLCSGEGSKDNAYFVIEGNKLNVAKKLTAGKQYSIRVKAANGDAAAEAVFTITATDKPADPTDASKDLPLDGMVAISDSQYLPGTTSEGPDDFILDNQTSTHWHTNWATTEATDLAKRWVGVSLPEAELVGGIRILPRQGNSSNGVITEYKVQYRAADDGEWTDVATGTWEASDKGWKIVEFDQAVTAKQIRIVGVHTYADSGNDAHMSLSEFRVVEGKEIVVEPDPEPTTPVTEIFADVTEGAWYVDAVQYVYDKGIMTGNAGLFSPDANVTRAVMVETLYKMEGKPAVTDFAAYDKMTDVAADAWYQNSVAWGMNNNVVTGDTYYMTFSPDANVTREQLATFLYRYANFKGVDTTLSTSVDEVLGGTYVADWAKEGFAWAVDSGIIKGAEVTGANGVVSYDLNPQGTATRAQLATMLQRFLESTAE